MINRKLIGNILAAFVGVFIGRTRDTGQILRIFRWDKIRNLQFAFNPSVRFASTFPYYEREKVEDFSITRVNSLKGRNYRASDIMFNPPPLLPVIKSNLAIVFIEKGFKKKCQQMSTIWRNGKKHQKFLCKKLINNDFYVKKYCYKWVKIRVTMVMWNIGFIRRVAGQILRIFRYDKALN